MALKQLKNGHSNILSPSVLSQYFSRNSKNILEIYLSVWSLENVTISRLSSGVFLQPNSRITSLCPKKLWTGKSRCLWFQRNSEWSFLCNWGTITVANLNFKNNVVIVLFIIKNNYNDFVTHRQMECIWLSKQGQQFSVCSKVWTLVVNLQD